jgi:cytochrome c-type biogenesis protein CcmH/NrfF
MAHILRTFLVLSLTAGVLQGQIPEGVEGTYQPHPEAEKAIGQLLSPFCPGLMLEQCPAQESRALRDSIHALAIDGWTSGELIGWMLSRHGENYRAVPQRSGWGVWAWILPPAALLSGFGGVLLLIRALRGTPEDEDEAQGATAGAAGPSPEEEARLREAIRELELAEDPSF